jgi:hypothetical protein
MEWAYLFWGALFLLAFAAFMQRVQEDHDEEG